MPFGFFSKIFHKHNKDAAYSCPTYTPNVNIPTGDTFHQDYDQPKEADVSVFLNFSTFDEQTQSITTSAFDEKIYRDQVYDNMANVDGGALTQKNTNGLTTKQNTAVETFYGFVSDGVHGKGTNFVYNNSTCQDFSGQFVAESDFDGDGKVSKEEFIQKANDLESERQAIAKQQINYYGRDGVDFSDQKVNATFDAMDANKDGNISDIEVDQFMDAVSSKTSFKREEEGVPVTYKNVTEIKFEDLPQPIKDATKTGEHYRYDSEPKTTTTVVDGDIIKLPIVEYSRKIKKNKKELIDGTLKIYDNNQAFAQALTTAFDEVKQVNSSATSVDYNSVLTKFLDNGGTKDEFDKFLADVNINYTNSNTLNFRLKGDGIDGNFSPSVYSDDNMDKLRKQNKDGK